MKLTIFKAASPLFFLFLDTVFTFQDCPLLGPVFPEPTQLSTSPTVKNATAALQSAIQEGIRTGTIESNLTSFSVEVFSVHESASLFEFHSAAPVLSNTTGTKTIDSNSIYRIGSISKLLTVYVFLIEAGDKYFHESITKHVPELAAKSSAATNDTIGAVDWEQVTIGNLASHLGGIGRDYFLADLSTIPSLVESTNYALPPLNPAEIPSCDSNCNRQQFFEGFTTRHPVYAPSTTPVYSNVAFQILAYALESITGKSIRDMLKEDLIEKLSLSGTSFSKPENNTHGVIASDGGYDREFGEFGPAGGFYSTTSDLASIGRSILKSSFLAPALTRRWMKPVAHTSNLNTAVGAPWEIVRMKLPGTNRLIDVYTKTGAISTYTSVLALIPDWGVGFVAMASGPGSWTIPAELVGQILLPAVEEAAREDAEKVYSGTYASTDPQINSQLTLTTDPSKPGLGVTNYVSNGTDILQGYIELLAGGGISKSELSMRLYPTNLDTQEANGDKKSAWRAVLEYTGGPITPPQVFDFSCATWVSVDTTMYGSVAFDDFVITVGAAGAISVEPRFFRIILERT